MGTSTPSGKERNHYKRKTWFSRLQLYFYALVMILGCSQIYLASRAFSSKALLRTMASVAEPPFSKPREIVKKLLSREQSEGRGARVRRSIGRPEMKNLDPFLMLDEFKAVGRGAGFPDHPHRGFETVSYVLKGAFAHEDFEGHKGTIHEGDLQWMTAGRGIVHSEMPDSDGEIRGLQLWVNLAAKDKMIAPAYQELLSRDIPKVEQGGVKVVVIAGTSLGTTSPVYTRTPTMYLDFTLQPGAAVHQPVTEGWNGFIYTLDGTATFGSNKEVAGPHNTLQFGPGDGITVSNDFDSPCHFVLIAGQPLNEPVVQYGPFVMNTQEEIMQTLKDYQEGKNGFEKAPLWKSTNGFR